MSEFNELTPEDLPAPTPELILFRAHAEATIAALGKKRARVYLETMGNALAEDPRSPPIIPLRPLAHFEALVRARRAAAYWFIQALPTFRARMPRD
jgi:hypothetical protein